MNEEFLGNFWDIYYMGRKMRKKVYTCERCKEQFDSFDELTFHIDNTHGYAEFLIEEIEDLPKHYKEIQNLRYPYLLYSAIDNKVYDSLRKQYYSLDNKDEIYKHPESPLILTLLFSKELAKNGIPEKDIPQKAKEEAYLNLMHHYLKNPTKMERLASHFDSEVQRLIETLQGKGNSCQLCGDYTFAYDSLMYKKLFLDKYGNLKKKPNPSLYTVNLVIDNKKAKVCLLRLMHILTKHASTLKTSSELGRIKGVDTFLKGLKPSEDPFNKILESFIKTPYKQEINVTSNKQELNAQEKGWLEWLNPTRYQLKRGEKNEERTEARKASH